jgi:phospholipid-binding lipoprotein MlaA
MIMLGSLFRLFFLGSFLLLSACVSNNSKDPFESYNRKMFAFNEAADKYVMRPVAETYVQVVPSPARSCISNIFSNIGEIWSGVNCFLQGKVDEGLEHFSRVAVNSTFGVLGCFDVASAIGMEKGAKEDFGQTLGKWGISDGPYVVLPFFGPSTLRDTTALVLADFSKGAQHRLISPVKLNYSVVDLLEPSNGMSKFVSVTDVVQKRASFLEAGSFLDDASTDKYAFLRDSYLQVRRNAVYDGDPPDLPEQVDFSENQIDKE